MEMLDVAICAQLACVLEASAPKPGNVNRYHDFSDTKYEHFLASGIALGAPAKKAAERGFKVGSGTLSVSNVGIGELIKEAVMEGKKWHTGGNTNLGIAMLIIPLSAAWGMSRAKNNAKEKALRKNVDAIIKSTTYKDSLSLYEAIRASNPGGMGRVEQLDVFDEASEKEIRGKRINMYHIMKATEGDSIAKELVTGMQISFRIGYPAIIDSYSKHEDISKAIVHAFLVILSKVPDSLIVRKKGLRAAEEVSTKAIDVLEERMSVEEFDRSLRDRKNSLNPGTTADLVASSTMIALLKGLRP